MLHYKQIETKGTKLIGMQMVLSGKQSENNKTIQKVWQTFNRNVWKIKNRRLRDDWEKFGVTYGAVSGKQYTYLAAVEVFKTDTIPENMIAKCLPAVTMVVICHQGSFTNLNKTYRTIYKEWLPSSGLPLTPLNKCGFNHFEKYDKRFQWSSKNSLIEIYIPIEDGIKEL